MRNLNLFLPHGETEIYLDEAIRNPNTMTLKHATVFWEYRNVNSTNDNLALGSKEITLNMDIGILR